MLNTIYGKDAKIEELQRSFNEKSTNVSKQVNWPSLTNWNVLNILLQTAQVTAKALHKKDDQIRQLEKTIQELNFRLHSKIRQSHCSVVSQL